MTSRPRRRRATITVVSPQQFRAVMAAGPRNSAVIAVPLSPDETWGAKADHPVGGSIGDRRVRGRLTEREGGWELTITPLWLRDTATAIGDDVTVSLAPEGPQRADLAETSPRPWTRIGRRVRSSTRWPSSTARPI